MQTLYIVAGELQIVSIGIERDEHEAARFFHPVRAVSMEDAEGKVRRHYERKTKDSFASGPYGTRYTVSDVKAWEEIGEATPTESND